MISGKKLRLQSAGYDDGFAGFADEMIKPSHRSFNQGKHAGRRLAQTDFFLRIAFGDFRADPAQLLFNLVHQNIVRVGFDFMTGANLFRTQAVFRQPPFQANGKRHNVAIGELHGGVILEQHPIP